MIETKNKDNSEDQDSRTSNFYDKFGIQNKEEEKSLNKKSKDKKSPKTISLKTLGIKSDDFKHTVDVLKKQKEETSPGRDLQEEAKEVDIESPILSDYETKIAVQNILASAEANLKQEQLLVEPESIESASIASAELLIADISEKLDSDKMSSAEIYDTALDDLMQDLGIDDEEMSYSIEDDETVDDENEFELADDTLDGIDPEASPEDDPDPSDNDSGDQNVKPPNSAGSGSGQPPQSPRTPTPGGGPPNPPFGPSAAPSYGPIVPPFTGNTFNTMVSASPEFIPNRRTGRRELLVGGIVGYLIGRRRGRIKTEKKLLPVQKSLETQVQKLHDELFFREEKIKSLTLQKLEALNEIDRQILKTRIRERSINRPRRPILSSEKINIKKADAHNPTKKTLGRLITKKSGEGQLTARQKEEVGAGRVTQTEVLEIAEKIEIRGASLKELFAQGRIDEKGLRLVVESYLAGDIEHKKIFSENETSNINNEMRKSNLVEKDRTDSAVPVAGQQFLSAGQTTTNKVAHKGTPLNTQTYVLNPKQRELLKNKTNNPQPTKNIFYAIVAVATLLVFIIFVLVVF